MADSLIDIFDLCVERLAAGETVEDCLRDYPDSAEELRSMLEMSLLVFQAQADTNDEQQAQAQTRTRIEAALQSDFAPRKGKNSMFTLRRSTLWIGGAAAAVFAFTFGFAFATTPAEKPFDPVAFQATQGYTEGEFLLTATQYVAEVTQTAQANLALLQPTIVQLVFESTPTAMMPLATARATATPLPSMTAIPTMESLGSSIEKPAVVSTSVAGYLAMTATRPPADGDGLKNTTDTDSAEAPAIAEPGREGDRGLTDGGDDTFREDSEVMAPTVVAPYSPDVSSGIIAPSIPLNQVQLDPMKAGEINDNADWDTYTEFRRNFLASYGSGSIIDLDITGRRIIKVVDAEGKPILGAHVSVTTPYSGVGSTTYATGMTLFFPDAQEESKRLDEFQVLVTYGQYQTSYTLDLRKVGDIVEIEMPFVIVRDGMGNETFIPTPSDQGIVEPTITPSSTWTPTPVSTLMPVMRAT